MESGLCFSVTRTVRKKFQLFKPQTDSDTDRQLLLLYLGILALRSLTHSVRRLTTLQERPHGEAQGLHRQERSPAEATLPASPVQSAKGMNRTISDAQNQPGYKPHTTNGPQSLPHGTEGLSC